MHHRLIGVLALALVTPALASAQIWTGWSSATPGAFGTMNGTLGSTSVQFAGGFSGYQLEDGSSLGLTQSGSLGNNYWNPASQPLRALPYQSAGVNEPDKLGLIQFSNQTFQYGGTVTFGSAVVNPLIAFISVGQPSVPVQYDFGANSFTLLSDNTGQAAYWGPGTNTVGVGNTASILSGNEFSGMIRLNGTFTSFSFTTSAEAWHGITIGTATTVPEPASLALVMVGIVGLGAAARRRRIA